MAMEAAAGAAASEDEARELLPRRKRLATSETLGEISFRQKAIQGIHSMPGRTLLGFQGPREPQGLRCTKERGRWA